MGDWRRHSTRRSIVFRGLRLADKHKSANITYKLPLPVFKRAMLREADLRGSFVLIPTSPSLLDKVTEFSTWRPESVRVPPVRPWPFPLGAENDTQISLADRAIDSFGISIPLLEFHEIGSRCGDPAASSVEAATVTVKEMNEDDDEDDEEEQIPVPAKAPVASAPAGISNTVRYPEHAFKRHPFVVARTQIRVVDETHLFNRKIIQQGTRQAALYFRSSSICGQDRPGGWAALDLCKRGYQKNGHWETRLKISIPEQNRTEWAFAPYMAHHTAAAGPKDYPLPVTRENCYQHQHRRHGHSPLKYFAGGGIMRLGAKRVRYNETEYKKSLAHDVAELWNGLAGHRFHPDSHPRRRFVITTLSSVSYGIGSVLTLSYWYTRTGTVGISILGTVLLALSDILTALVGSLNGLDKQKPGHSPPERFIFVGVMGLMLFIVLLWPMCMLKTALRLSFDWVVTAGFPPWVLKLGICITLIVLDYTLSPFDYHILSPLHPPRGDSDWDWDHSRPWIRMYLATWYPLKITGIFSQILLNHRSKTFAGSYKLTLVLRCVSEVLQGFKFLEIVVGRYDARPGLNVLSVLNWVMFGMLAWQAFVFPKVVLKADEED
ncbi:hypothetical protein FB45DRAFT_1033201 [Roridomyces roridus]|uniref:Uncharacterized protein n=1 Tax=Roridomyces roridus TaxID=1738132 RepID=A0AAD7BFN9_9AGAR|nr:hypothetical protein FB45DRAFT_1033201 [Roridomyces roridus]